MGIKATGHIHIHKHAYHRTFHWGPSEPKQVTNQEWYPLALLVGTCSVIKEFMTSNVRKNYNHVYSACAGLNATFSENKLQMIVL